MATGKKPLRTARTLPIAASCLTLLLSCFAPASLPVFAASQQVIELNNEGVKALNAGNFPLAITKFEAALKIDSTYSLARENLAICYNNYGLQLQNNPKEAIKQFHKAMYLLDRTSTSKPKCLQTTKAVDSASNSATLCVNPFGRSTMCNAVCANSWQSVFACWPVG